VRRPARHPHENHCRVLVRLWIRRRLGLHREQVRQADPAFLAKVETAAPGLVAKVRSADLANLRAILEKNGITWKQAAQGSTMGPLPRRWNVASWPTIYVLDAKGVIRFKNLRGEELENAAGKLIAEMEKDGKR